jgi:hypothetical protein
MIAQYLFKICFKGYKLLYKNNTAMDKYNIDGIIIVNTLNRNNVYNWDYIIGYISKQWNWEHIHTYVYIL